MLQLLRARTRFFGLLPAAGLFVLMLVVLVFLSKASENSVRFGHLYSVLLWVNVTGLVIFLALIGASVWRFLREYRSGVIGTRLTLRLALVLMVVAVVPVSTVYYFSLQFIQRGIDSWFDVRIEAALNDALELSRASLDQQLRDKLRQTEAIGRDLGPEVDARTVTALEELRAGSGALELSLLRRSGQILATSSSAPAGLVPHRPDEVVMAQALRGTPYVALDPVRDEGLFVRVVVGLPGNAGDLAQERVLQALYPVPGRLGELLENVNNAFGKYRELVYLRQPLKASFTLTLSLVLLLTLLAAVWVALYSAQRLVAPIRVLAAGTRSVAAGDYDHKLPSPGGDEFGTLVQSFNDMTERIAQARDVAAQSQQQAERERAYLRAVLGGLSSGVLTLDRHHVLRTGNAAAEQVLEITLAGCVGQRFHALAKEHSHLAQSIAQIIPHLDNAEREWQEEIAFVGQGGRKVLMCRGAALPGVRKDRPTGYVIVFDDVTTLIQAQRDAAWAEVARRLAHEIKNPLTPIQLSAERLRRRYLDRMSPEEAEVLDRSTHTIVQQVKAMEEMVRAFAEYARSPKLQIDAVDVNALVTEVLDLYHGDDRALAFDVKLEPTLGTVEADAGRLRQLLHNLVKNALEAMESTAHPCLTMLTRTVDGGSAGPLAELRVQDNGPGIPEALLDQLFEPYVTTKARGTGLGLAVVKKIVEEHGGAVWAENLPGGGAAIVLRLPFRSAHVQRPATASPNVA